MNKHSIERRNWASLIAVVAVIVCLTVLAVPSVVAQSNSDLKYVVDPTSVAYGRTYSEWSAAWWQWAMSIPVASHPIFDNGDCSVGQSGPVWFLGGKACAVGQDCPPPPWTRYCTVPAGKALYFPILNMEQSEPEEPNWGCGNGMPPLVSGTIAEMRACIESYIAGSNSFEADLDGKHIRNIDPNFHIQAVTYDDTWPDDNWLTATGEGPFPAGTYFPAVDDGWYVLLSPLPPGQHTLHFQGTWPWGSSQNMTYHLTVKSGAGPEQKTPATSKRH